MRKLQFIEGEFYHIYNRGVDKRDIYADKYDFQRFLQSMEEFNVAEPIGSIYENSFRKKKLEKLGHRVTKKEKLVNIVCYCLNPNHYHFILEQVANNGISLFMHKLGMGYSRYFNEKYKRSGSLFQGTYKAIHIQSNSYLLYLSAYINLNNRVHRLGDLVSKSSWGEYIGEEKSDFCKKDMILGQYDSREEYKEFAGEALGGILERRYDDLDNLEKLFLE